MEILLIGNGFDLEHGLPTSYAKFLEFCQRVCRIYTYVESKEPSYYKQENLNEWDFDQSIKEILFNAYENREWIKGEDTDDIEVTTSYGMLNELKNLIIDNAWFEYFLIRNELIGENWIDFESEISRVIKGLENGRFQLTCGGSVRNIDAEEYDLIFEIWKNSNMKYQSVFENIKSLDEFTDYLNQELERLIRALEIFIAGVINEIPVAEKSPDIEGLLPDHILSFNYSNTFERVYGDDQFSQYNFIHGKADLSRNVKSCNLVLGIDEDFHDEEDEKNNELTCLSFKKYYQRIYKSTDNDYLLWIDEIKQGYNDYVFKTGCKRTSKRGPFKSPSQRLDMRATQYKYPEHNLYIFGHSLDVTDRDILKELICNDNVQTKIFYYRQDENDKSILDKIIRNLVKIMGPEELIRRTGGVYQTIEFIPQTIKS